MITTILAVLVPSLVGILSGLVIIGAYYLFVVHLRARIIQADTYKLLSDHYDSEVIARLDAEKEKRAGKSELKLTAKQVAEQIRTRPLPALPIIDSDGEGSEGSRGSEDKEDTLERIVKIAAKTNAYETNFWSQILWDSDLLMLVYNREFNLKARIGGGLRCSDPTVFPYIEACLAPYMDIAGKQPTQLISINHNDFKYQGIGQPWYNGLGVIQGAVFILLDVSHEAKSIVIPQG